MSIANEVMNIDGRIIKLINSMFKIMYKSHGIGLAAPQIAVGKRIITVDTGELKGPPICLVNPEIVESSEKTNPYEEGCLSLPGIVADITRPSNVLVRGISPEEGREIEIEAKGLLARVLQHEIDHLNGIVFVDRLEDSLKNNFAAQLRKIKRMNRTA